MKRFIVLYIGTVKFRKKVARHILAYCTDPYLLTSVLIVCHSSLHAETLNC